MSARRTAAFYTKKECCPALRYGEEEYADWAKARQRRHTLRLEGVEVLIHVGEAHPAILQPPATLYRHPDDKRKL